MCITSVSVNRFVNLVNLHKHQILCAKSEILSITKNIRRWKIIKRLNLCLLAFLLIFYPIYAFSAVPDFINNPEAWFETDGIITQEISDYSNISGFYSYYTDIDKHSIFIHISYAETHLKNEDNEIKINFSVSNTQNRYSFTVAQNGITDSTAEAKAAFSVSQNFGRATEQGHEIYIGIEFKNKQDIKCSNSLQFSVDVNGHCYDINRIIELPYKEFSESTKESSTKSDVPSTKEKNENGKSTSQKETTTKFRYVPSDETDRADNTLWHYNGNPDNQEYSTYNETVTSGRNTIITEAETKASLSTFSKIMLFSAAAMIIGGIALILYCLLKRPPAEIEKTADLSDNEPDES